MNKFFAVCVLALLLCGCQVTEEGVLFHTADPNLMVGFRFAPTTVPVPVPTVEPEVIPEEEVGETVPDPTPVPPCDMIKGNISSSGEKIFHIPGGANYDQVKIDTSKGEAFFCSEGEAVQAGFRKARR